MRAEEAIAAARVPLTLQPQDFGLWRIQRVRVTALLDRLRCGFDSMTVLRKYTDATLHSGGEVVMEDSRQELERHLPIMLRAKGRVLVSGLGLGCVVRGLLANPAVGHVDVVEIDPDITRIVGAEFASNERVEIHVADALAIDWLAGTRWDFAWHDLHVDDNFGELQRLHAKLFVKYDRLVKSQGAWGFPRVAKRKMRGYVAASGLLG